jgi:hypothetical protein
MVKVTKECRWVLQSLPRACRRVSLLRPGTSSQSRGGCRVPTLGASLFLSLGWESKNSTSQSQLQPFHRLTPSNPPQLPVQMLRRRLRLSFIVFVHIRLLPSLDRMRQARSPKRLQEQERHPQAHGRRLNPKKPFAHPRSAYPPHPLHLLITHNQRNDQKWSPRQKAQDRKSIHMHKHTRVSQSALLKKKGHSHKAA